MLLAAGLAGCGGSSKSSATSTGRSSTAAQPPPTSAQAAAGAQAGAAALPGLSARVLRDGELRGFIPQAPAVRGVTPESWVVAAEYPPSQRAGAAAEFRRLGLVAAMRERLAPPSGQGAEAISIVERFQTPAGAQSNLAAETRLSPGESAFSVTGIPGARGFGGSSAESSGLNVAFTKGAYFYLVGVGGPKGVSLPGRPALIAATMRLYGRVRP
jgi:hypothetical protein